MELSFKVNDSHTHIAHKEFCILLCIFQEYSVHMANSVTNNFLPLWIGQIQSNKILEKFPLCFGEKQSEIDTNLNVYLVEEDSHPCFSIKDTFKEAFVASISYGEPTK